MQLFRWIWVAQRSLSSLVIGCYQLLTIGFGLTILTHQATGQNINRQQVRQLLSQLQHSKTAEKQLPILVELGKFHIYKPGEANVDLDSGRAYLNQAKRLSDSLHLLTWQHEIESMLIVAAMEGGNSQLGRLRFAQLIDDCRKTGDRAAEANVRVRLGIWLRNVDNDYREVFANFRQAAAIYKSLRDQQKEINAFKEVGITYLYQGKLDSAQAVLTDVLAQYKAIGYPKLHYTYNLLATVNTLKGDFDKGLSYALLCIDSMDKTKDTVSAASFYGDLARIYEEIGNHSKGVEWHRKSLQAWRQERLPNFAMYNTASFIAKDLIHQQKPREALQVIKTLVNEIPTNTIIQKASVAQSLAYCYDALHNDRLAERYYLETLDWYAKNKMDFEASQQAEIDIGGFYVQQKNFRKAAVHLTKALSFYPQKNSLSTIKDLHFLLFKVDSAQGNYLSAMRHFRQHKALNDSLFNETKSKQIASLQIRYDTRKKEQDIALLTKQSELQQSELKYAQASRNYIIAGTILLAGLLGVSYNRYRLKKRSNEQLQTQQQQLQAQHEELQTQQDALQGQQQEINQKNEYLQRLLEEKEWMLKEIHHRVKNNLQVVSSLLNAQSDYLNDPQALTAIQDSRNRVHAMALIHQKLYQSNSLALVDMREYIDEIVDYLMESFDRRESVSAVLNVAALQFDVSLATPIGLIINEAVTNSLKYAFPHGSGLITIELRGIQDQAYGLTISDNGVGMPPEFDLERSDTLGLTMIRGLSRQIGGQLDISQQSGVHIHLEFSPVKQADKTIWA
ncbi:signal transduction histidine kinase [Fibrisoma limi BUZ 3]|uniref:histidine kinase n=1 Tax=Fibrisoma limi BUZ 3 TaxID=1185876 RepID=I2GI47_9BACT|nr:histidine kinase dimerization/phosphoacceptor domain -containing protein [Fibrisoma limi]CCH53572.1 signal transduction histidine kinase [Fibrisoma limi BUZ 3]